MKYEMETGLCKIKNNEDVFYGLEQLRVLDPHLGEVMTFVKSAGVRVPLRLRPGGFAGLAEIVISQLVSKVSANAIYLRFLEQVNPLTPQQFLEVGEEGWRKIGLSRPKQKTLVAVSDAIQCGTLDLVGLGELQVEDAMRQLTAIKGIGPWSAQVYLLFCCGHRDIFPAGDLALREAARIMWRREARPCERELEQHAEQWAPWRGVAARLLWAFYAVHKEGDGKFE